MTIQQLQYILEVQRTGSASNAAKNLFVSQSAISTSISGMEAELGFPIFERTRRGMVPTLRGMHALEHAAKICASYEEMQQTCIVEKKQIRINSVDLAPFSDAFVQLINETKDRDDLQFLMNSGLGPDNAINQVAAGNLDLAVLLILPFAVAYKEEMIRRNCDSVIANRRYTQERLNAMGFALTDSSANFIFMKHPQVDGGQIYEEMKRRGVLIRHFTKSRMAQYNRVTIGSREQMDVFLEVLGEVIEELK